MVNFDSLKIKHFWDTTIPKKFLKSWRNGLISSHMQFYRLFLSWQESDISVRKDPSCWQACLVSCIIKPEVKPMLVLRVCLCVQPSLTVLWWSAEVTLVLLRERAVYSGIADQHRGRLHPHTQTHIIFACICFYVRGPPSLLADSSVGITVRKPGQRKTIFSHFCTS